MGLCFRLHPKVVFVAKKAFRKRNTFLTTATKRIWVSICQIRFGADNFAVTGAAARQ